MSITGVRWPSKTYLKFTLKLHLWQRQKNIKIVIKNIFFSVSLIKLHYIYLYIGSRLIFYKFWFRLWGKDIFFFFIISLRWWSFKKLSISHLPRLLNCSQGQRRLYNRIRKHNVTLECVKARVFRVNASSLFGTLAYLASVIIKPILTSCQRKKKKTIRTSIWWKK